LRCEDLKIGDVIRVSDSKLKLWFADDSSRTINNIPQIKIGSPEVALMAASHDVILSQEHSLLYVGLLNLDELKYRMRQIRLFYVNGSLGYVEYYDIEFLERIPNCGT